LPKLVFHRIALGEEIREKGGNPVAHRAYIIIFHSESFSLRSKEKNKEADMGDFLANWYLWIKALHVISVIAWMAGLFYLPRLYVYHVEGLKKRGVERGSEMDLLFQHQESLLLQAITTPAGVASWAFGLGLVLTPGIVVWSEIWPWTKLVALLGMTGFHLWLMVRRQRFLDGSNAVSGRTYRMMNEVPTVFLVVIVCSVIVKF
jgi:protoporphyrinogen IX oxidase